MHIGEFIHWVCGCEDYKDHGLNMERKIHTGEDSTGYTGIGFRLLGLRFRCSR